MKKGWSRTKVLLLLGLILIGLQFALESYFSSLRSEGHTLTPTEIWFFNHLVLWVEGAPWGIGVFTGAAVLVLLLALLIPEKG